MFDLLKSLGALTGAELVGPVTAESAPSGKEVELPQTDQVEETQTEKDAKEETGADRRLSEGEAAIVKVVR